MGGSLRLGANKIDIREREVIVLGAGGTAKSILFSIKQLGVKHIILVNRTFIKAKELQDDIVVPYQWEQIESVIKNDSIIINSINIFIYFLSHTFSLPSSSAYNISCLFSFGLLVRQVSQQALGPLFCFSWS